MNEERFTELVRRVQALELEVEALKRQRQGTSDGGVRRNQVGDNIIKLVKPGVYHFLDHPHFGVGFPRNRAKLAGRIAPGTAVYIYVTSPERWIIGKTRVTGPMRGAELNPDFPHELPLQWEIGPKAVGVTFADAKLEVRPRVGDTVFAISPEVATELDRLLRANPDLGPQRVELLRDRYREIP